jgi:eukaryotic-like serine/threonine-protein kinase
VSKLEPGMVFGRDFRIVRALREGGMGAVYVADQLSTGKQRALKVMAAELAVDPSIRERFVLEAHAASRIESDHVVEIVTSGVDEETGAPFLVMELLRGEELAEAAARLGSLPLGDVAEVLSQIGHALEQAHAQGIVHRDLKPENIFLVTSRRRDVPFTAKVLDFGIAKLVEDSRQKTGTQPLGTPLFMAPEQTDRKGRICPATDVWALGLITFRLLTGRDFWLEADGSLPMLLREIVVDPIPFATARAAELAVRPPEPGFPVPLPVPALPPGFDAWFARCVNRDVDARFQDAGAAVRAFMEVSTPDAPRGALIASSDWVSSPITTTPSLSGPRSGRISVRPPGTTGAPAATGAVTGATMVQATGATGVQATGAQGAQGSRAGLLAAVAGGVAVLGIGGLLAYRAISNGPPPGPAAGGSAGPVVTAVASAATGSSATAASGAAGAPLVCAEGMVAIPGGKMFMGARDLAADAKPPHEVTVSGFCLDRTEVTTRAYLVCADKGECERPLEKVSWPGIKPDMVKLYSGFCNAGHKDRGEHPINCVAWTMADIFCKKHGARLPTEAEWEFAARGAGQRKYPWGDEAPGPRYLNACGKECAKWFKAKGEKTETMYDGDDGYAGTAPVGSFPEGASASGVLDLAGNVWEWTNDWYGPYSADPATDPKGPPTGTMRVARGGNFTGYNPDWARPAFRWKTDPDTFNHAIGFRCAASPK